MIKVLKAIFARRRMREELELPEQISLIDEVALYANKFDPDIVSRADGSSAWRQTSVDTLHRDIYHLVAALHQSATAVKYRDTPGTEVTKSRNIKDNLTPNTLVTYLVDAEGRTVPAQAAFKEVKSATLRLIEGIKKLESNPNDEHFDYYLRQNNNLFEELVMVFKLYIEAS